MNNLIKHVCKRCLLFKYLDSSSLILAFEGGFSERFGTCQIPFGFVLCEVKKKAIKPCAIYLAFINYLLVLPLNIDISSNESLLYVFPLFMVGVQYFRVDL